MAAKKSAKKAKKAKPVVSEARVREWYRERVALFEALESTAKKAVLDMLSQRGTPHIGVFARVKSEDSLVRKVAEKKYTNLDTRVTDLVGLRIVALTDTDVADACNIVADVFRVHRTMSGDKADALGDDRFGYRSVHFTCDLGAARARLAENARLKGLRFEVQVRTVVQHAWAEIEHDRVYKRGGQLPPGAKRRFNRIAALLESADSELDRLCSDIAAHQASLEKPSAPSGPTTVDDMAMVRFAVMSLGKAHGISARDAYSRAVVLDQLQAELRAMGINTLKQVLLLFDEPFIASVKRYAQANTWVGLLRDAMLYKDIDRYFDKAWQEHWNGIFGTSYDALVDRWGKTKVDNIIRASGVNVGAADVDPSDEDADLGDEDDDAGE